MEHPNEMFMLARQIAGGTVKSAHDFAVLCSSQLFQETNFDTSALRNNLEKALERLTYLAYLSERSRIALAKREITQNKRENMRCARAMIKKTKANKVMYAQFVCAIAMWEPPTDEHKLLKELMLKEIKGYIHLDGVVEYWQKRKKSTDFHQPAEAHAAYIINVAETMILTYDGEIDRLEEAEMVHDDFMQKLRSSFQS
jgi:hypothetical protein